MKFTRKGYIEVLRDDLFISRHTAAEEAYESAYAHAEANGGGIYVIRYPNRELDLSSITKVRLSHSWSSAPVLTFVQGTASSVNLASYVANPAGKTLTYSVTGDLPTGCTLSGSSISYDGAGAASESSVVLSVSDGTYEAVTASVTASVVASIDTQAPVFPASPLSLVASTTSISVSWQAATDNVAVTGYELQRSLDNATWTTLYSGTSRSCADTGLSSGTLHYYRVRAFDAAGNYSGYGTASATTQSGATGFDYYISPTGSNSNPGTEASPWAISALTDNNKVIGGKRIGLLPGTYDLTYSAVRTGYGGPAAINYIAARITQSGTAQSPTVIESTVPRAAILKRPTGSVMQTQANGGPLFLVERGASYCQWKNITFDTNMGNGSAIQLLGDYALVEGCEFKPVYNYLEAGENYWGDNLGAIYFDLAGQTPIKDPVVRNNKFLGAYNGGPVSVGYPTTSSNNSAAVFGFSVENMLFENNTCTNMGGMFRTKYDWYGFTIRYNHGYNIGDWMQHLAVPPGFSGRVTYNNNLVFGGAGGYIYETSQKNADADIFNNTIINSGGGGAGSAVIRWWRESNDPNTTSTFKNNLLHVTNDLVSPKFVHLFVQPWETIMSAMDYNLYPNGNSGYFRVAEGTDNYNPDAIFSTLAAWRSESRFEANATQATPTFVGSNQAIASDWKLQSGSAGKTSGEGGVEVGCWGGSNPPSQIGCSF